jgi:hypothetical protein
LTSARHSLFDDRAEGQRRPREVMLDRLGHGDARKAVGRLVAEKVEERAALVGLGHGGEGESESGPEDVAADRQRQHSSEELADDVGREVARGGAEDRTVTWKASSFFVRTSPTGPQTPGGYSTLERMCALDVTMRSPRSRFVTAQRAAAVCWLPRGWGP